MGADVIQDASVKTGGAEAKDPMGTGLIINIITRSGGNELSTSASYDHQEYDWGTGDGDGLTGFFGDNELPEQLRPVRLREVELRRPWACSTRRPTSRMPEPERRPRTRSTRPTSRSAGPSPATRPGSLRPIAGRTLRPASAAPALDVGFLQALSGLPASGGYTTPTYSEFPNTTRSHQPYLKLTAQLNPNHELSGYYQRDQLQNTSNREYDLAHAVTS